MVSLSSIPPAGIVSGPLPNVQPQAVVQAAAAASASPTAQQLLPTAVVATTLVPQYLTDTPKPPKPVLRQAATSPSSALAAQFIAQTLEASDEQLAVFSPRVSPSPQQVPRDEPEFLSQLRLARGDLPPETAATAQNVAAKAASVATPVATTTTNVAMLSTAVSSAPVIKQAVPSERGTIQSQQTVSGRKSSLTQTRGAAAYALAELRNVSGIVPANVEAVG
jgi:hypothetical protein